MDILIFDMDGVLIDVSKSYRRTIQKTVQIYFETCLGLKGSKNLTTDEDISLFKEAGGFNNDWDLTSGLILYMLSISDIPPSSKQERLNSIQNIVFHLRENSSGFLKKNAIRSNEKQLILFLKKVKTSGGGLRGVQHALTTSWDGWVYRSGEIDQTNLVKRIFQEIYLGKKFIYHYQLKPFFYKRQGYYLQERLLIPKNILSRLHKKINLGIASGRPRFEAELALKRFCLSPYFKSVVTLDEIEEEEERILRSTGKKVRRSKPHPYSLMRVVQEIGIPNTRCGYVGDVVDDMLVARSARKEVEMTAIGFLPGKFRQKSQKESLRQAGADLIIKNPKELLRFIA